MQQQPSSSHSPQQPASPKLHHSVSLPVSLPTPAQKLHQLFNLPDFKTNKLYQKTIREVVELLGQFDKFTDHLQAKVDFLLNKQQSQFIDSYKQHMKKIENQFKIMQEEVRKQDQLIKYYQNEGKMSNLIKKVALLEQQSKKLYEIIAKKQKQIKSVRLDNIVQKQQMKRMHTQIKELNKAKNQQLTQIQLHENLQNKQKQKSRKTLLSEHSNQQLKFFTTEVQEQKSLTIKKDLSITTDENKKVGFSYNLSEKSILCPESEHEPRLNPSRKQLLLQKQLQNLSLKHRKLAKINSKVLEDKNELQNLFIRAVADIKRQIIVKKKIKQCTFEDFKKEDKINLLLIIISNEEILRYVYEKIFGSKEKVDAIERQYSTVVAPVAGGPVSRAQGNNGQSVGGAGNSKRANSTKNKVRTSVLPYI